MLLPLSIESLMSTNQTFGVSEKDLDRLAASVLILSEFICWGSYHSKKFS